MSEAWFWCPIHDEAHRDDELAGIDKGIHRSQTRDGRYLIGPYPTRHESEVATIS